MESPLCCAVLHRVFLAVAYLAQQPWISWLVVPVSLPFLFCPSSPVFPSWSNCASFSCFSFCLFLPLLFFLHVRTAITDVVLVKPRVPVYPPQSLGQTTSTHINLLHIVGQSTRTQINLLHITGQPDFPYQISGEPEKLPDSLSSFARWQNRTFNLGWSCSVTADLHKWVSKRA